MIRVGITGGIGSGKTTVCRIFEVLGVPVYYADDRAKALMVEDDDLRTGIKQLFGSQAYHDDGSLNRAYIAQRAFSDNELLEELNGLVHPAVWRDGEAWQKEHSGATYTLKEAALLYESGGHHLLDVIIVVAAPDEVRIKRVMARDGVSREEVETRMSKQLPQRDKVERADYLVVNDGNRSLIQQVMTIHRDLIEQSASFKNSNT